MTKKIFMSYRSSDRLQVQALMNAIQQSGDYEIWYDQDLRGGQKWWDEIMHHLQAADIVVLALSNDYLASYPCKLERDYARQLNKAIVPIRIDSNLKDQDLEYDLATAQYVRYDAYTQDKTRLQEALAAAQSGQAPYPVPPPPKTPIPPLTKIRQDVTATAPLSYETQKELVEQLRWHNKENPGENPEVKVLLQQLVKRPEAPDVIREEAKRIIDDIVKSQYPNKRLPLVVGISALLIVAVVIAAIMLNNPSDNPDATNTPGNATTPIPSEDAAATPAATSTQPINTAQSGAFDVSLLYGGLDSFAIKVNEASHLFGLTLESADKVDTIVDSFPELGAVNFIGQSGICLRYIRESSNPPLPRACEPENTFVVTLAGGDVFWYNDSTNQYANIALKRDGEVIRLCSHNNGSGVCDVRGS